MTTAVESHLLRSHAIKSKDQVVKAVLGLMLSRRASVSLTEKLGTGAIFSVSVEVVDVTSLYLTLAGKG